MRLNRNPLDDLLLECDSARCAAHERQQLVIKPLPPAKPASAQIEGYPRHEHEVQPVQGYDGAAVRGFPDAEPSRLNVLRRILNAAGDILARLRMEA
jgi:hypothetical protein